MNQRRVFKTQKIILKSRFCYEINKGKYVQAKESAMDLSLYKERLKRNIYLLFNEDFDALPKELKNMIVNGIVLNGV